MSDEITKVDARAEVDLADTIENLLEAIEAIVDANKALLALAAEILRLQQETGK